jgi:hypothetical protein
MRGLIFGVVAGGAVFFNTDQVSGDSYMWLSLAGLVAGFIDSVAGGGGLITVPALMYVGLPVHLALGTNKMQSSFGTCVAVWRYWGAGLISSTQIQYSVFWTLAAAAAGAWCVGKLDDAVLRRFVPIFLIAIAVYMIAGPHFSKRRPVVSGDALRREDACASFGGLSPRAFGGLAGCTLGFYDGFFGPGTGAFWTIAWMSLQGLDLMRATAATKVVNLASNVASLAVFIYAGQVRWDCAGVMIVGQVLGARLGSGLAMKNGEALIRPLFTLVVVALAFRLLMR